MKIYLIRHSSAVDISPRMTDAQVHLTFEGRRIARAVGKALRDRGAAIEHVISSPYARALQTAELIAERLDYIGVIETNNSLMPEVPARAAAQEISHHSVDIAIVGHEPSISALGAILVGRPSFPPFKRGQVSCIEDGKPLWFLDPERIEFKPLLIA